MDHSGDPVGLPTAARVNQSEMPKAVRIYVKYVDAVSRAVGRLAMYLIFVMISVLLFSALSRTIFNVSYIWVVEIAQFLLAAYYILGGGYSMQLDGHVRMDLFYGRWSPRTQAMVDALTSLVVMSYLVFLLAGGVSSTMYALTYGQKNYSAWAPPLAPIKIIMVIGITLMLLQMLAVFFKDIAKARGEPLP